MNLLCGIVNLMGLCDLFSGSNTYEVAVYGLGIVIGNTDYTSWSNRKIYSFQNIPYAEPPIGDLRFRPPVKVKKWNGILDATKPGNVCPQYTMNQLNKASNEDCLHLNVFVPEVRSNVTDLPVMIFLHGGIFIENYASQYKPNYLLEEDVILVVPEFRLGVLGLMCLHTDEVPGNVMFLDQIMAMQWVQDNIQYFGGDKHKVTLFGESSGAVATNLHMLSPLSRGLFQRAIIQSGAVLSTWIMDYDPVSTAKEFAAHLGCNETSISGITTCMKNASMPKFLATFNTYFYPKVTTGGLKAFKGNRAVIQRAGKYKFLTDDPQNIVNSGNYTKLPIMGGSNKHDGGITIHELYQTFLVPRALLNDSEFLKNNITELVVNSIGISDITSGIADVLINTFFQNGKLGKFNEMVLGLTDISSFFHFKAPVRKMLHHNSFHRDSYLFAFNYHGSLTMFDTSKISNYPSQNEVGHTDDLIYLFPQNHTLTQSDLKVAKRMIQLWTSFAIKGVPTAEDVDSWPVMSTRAGPYLIIDESATTGENFFREYSAATRAGLNNTSSK